jgi:hypothetical protein
MTHREHELSQQLFGGQPQQSMGAIGAIKEAFKELRDNMAPGLTWDKISSDIGKELSHQVGAGAHELASLLFTGQGYVQYQRQGKDDRPQQEQTQDGQAMHQDTPSQHLERGGRSM